MCVEPTSQWVDACKIEVEVQRTTLSVWKVLRTGPAALFFADFEKAGVSSTPSTSGVLNLDWLIIS